MPPKKPPATSKKNENKKKDKVIDDKTFGLKNKKGAKNQKYIAQVEKQVKAGGNPEFKKSEQLRAEQIKKKAEEDKKQAEMRELFKPIAVQKIQDGVDPKSVFCAFFKQKLCKKGDKCKFSHDPDVERKAAKRNIYEAEEEEEEDAMDDWDYDKLAEVVAKKHGAEKLSNATDIICKHFLDALENSKYGWFWECPDKAKQCKYKHALPKGYVLKKDKKKAERERDEVSLEDLIEKERANLDTSKLTKVNLETFVAWKKKKFREKKLEEEKLKDKKKTDMKSGKTGGLSGKDIFTFNPSVLSGEGTENDEEGGDFEYEREEEDVGVKIHEIKFDEYGIMDDGLDDPTDTQLARNKAEREAQAGPSGAAAPAATVIDEDLFDDEDLDELEDDLDDLEI